MQQEVFAGHEGIPEDITGQPDTGTTAACPKQISKGHFIPYQPYLSRNCHCLTRPGARPAPPTTPTPHSLIHFLRPVTIAFHAHVALGSMWKEEPERAGPRMSHLVRE